MNTTDAPPEPGEMFNREAAPRYDAKFQKLAPMKDALHLMMQIVMRGLPERAHVLCVGVGTGAELLYLAEAFPQWHFTAVEPAEPMLDICRERVEAAGMTHRCDFHAGFVDTLQAPGAFDAATAILVSHFITDDAERLSFFKALCDRVTPGGLVVTADITVEEAVLDRMKTMWLAMMKYSGMPEADLEHMRAGLGTRVSLMPPTALAALLTDAGLVDVTPFYQALMMRAHVGRVAPPPTIALP